MDLVITSLRAFVLVVKLLLEVVYVKTAPVVLFLILPLILANSVVMVHSQLLVVQDAKLVLSINMQTLELVLVLIVVLELKSILQPMLVVMNVLPVHTHLIMDLVLTVPLVNSLMVLEQLFVNFVDVVGFIIRQLLLQAVNLVEMVHSLVLVLFVILVLRMNMLV